MIKIAIYFNGKSRFGGAERRISRTMNDIAGKGIDVTLVFKLFEDFEIVKKTYEELIGDPCRIKMIGFNSGMDIFHYVRKNKFDMVFYTEAYRAMIPFFLGAVVSGSERVMLQVSTGPSIGEFVNVANRLLFELVARGSTRIDCLYPSTTNRIKEKYKKQIVTTTPCPSTDNLKFLPKDKERTLAFISRWVEGKNVELFVESMLMIEELLYTEGYSVLLCGNNSEGRIEERVSEMIAKANHPEIFKTMGYVHSEDILPRAEVFFSLQKINNYPSQSLLEAISCGCYIIASDEGDTSSIVKTDFGSLCQLQSKSIAECTANYINYDPLRKEQIVSNATTFARDHFSINDSIDHYYSMITNSESYGV